MPIVLDGTTGITAPDVDSKVNGLNYPDASSMGFRNRIINGNMVIDQRNNGASVSTAAGSSAYTLDRWNIEYTQTSKFTLQQNAGSVAPPTGYTNYLGVTSSSAYSVVSGDFFAVQQRIEGFNSADLAWGTASASAITVSFWVRSSLTGTFGGAIRNSAGTRSYPFTYAVSAANTWEQKTVTIPGDTSGTWLTNNGIGVRLDFSLGAGATWSGTAGSWQTAGFMSATGATSVVGTSGATFYITGVQLEAGSVATPFEQIDYGRELIMCQRYFEKSYEQTDAVGASGKQGYSASPVGSNTVPISQVYSQVSFAVTKRATPTITIYGFNGGSGRVSNTSTGADLAANSGIINSSGTQGIQAANGSGGTLSTAFFSIVYHWTASSEL